MSAGHGKTAAFDLDELVSTTPDRIEVRGAFTELSEALPEAPRLLVAVSEGSDRLPAVSLSGAPAAGCPWRAEFAWSVPLFLFDSERLENRLARIREALDD